VSPRRQLLPLSGAAPSNAYPSPPSSATEPAAAGSSVPPTAQRAPARVSSPPKQLPLRTKAPSPVSKRPLAAPPSNGSAAPAPALQSNMKLPTVNQPTTLAAPLLQRPSAVPSPPPSVPYEAEPQPSYSPSAASRDATLASANLEPQRASELRHAQHEVTVDSPPPPTGVRSRTWSSAPSVAASSGTATPVPQAPRHIVQAVPIEADRTVHQMTPQRRDRRDDDHQQVWAAAAATVLVYEPHADYHDLAAEIRRQDEHHRDVYLNRLASGGYPTNPQHVDPARRHADYY
jgi:hypothetical protein